MKLRHPQRLVGQVDSEDVGTRRAHRFGQDAAAAADIEHPLAGQRGPLVDPVEPQRIDLVQRTKRSGRIPPPVGQFAELLQLGRIDIHRLRAILNARSCAIRRP